MQAPRDPDALRNGLTAAFAIIIFALFIKIGTDQAELSDLRQDTAEKNQQTEKIRAEHDRRLVSYYEPALTACLNGVGFTVGNTFVLCSPTQVTP